MEPAQQKRNTTAETMRTLGGLSTVGLTFVFAVLIGAGAGYLLMTYAGMGRWVFFLGFVLGVAAAILNVYRTANRFLK
jgi:F0F1-type ATP synthase assembly protein I